MEDKKLTMQEYRVIAESKTVEYNNAVLNGKFDDAHALDEVISDAVSKFTVLAKNACFNRLAESSNIMLAAVNKRTFTTIKIKDTTEKSDDGVETPVRKIVEATKDIDLLDLQKYVKHNIGNSPDWNYMIDKLGMHLTVKVAYEVDSRLKSKIESMYELKKIAQQVDLGNNPCSKTKILKTVQSIVDAMLGDGYKASSHDVAFILNSITKVSKGRDAISMVNDRTLRRIIADVCYHCVIGDHHYNVESKHVKD